MRGRAAFLIACLENSVQHENLTHPRWQAIITGCWNYLGEVYSFQDFEYFVTCRTPSYYLDFTWEEYYDDDDELTNSISETEFNELKLIFSNPTIAGEILEQLYFISYSGVYGAHSNELDFRVIDRCIAFLISNGIPLPLFENFIPFVWNPVDIHDGELTRKDVFPKG